MSPLSDHRAARARRRQAVHCCPACAASARRPARRRRSGGRPPWAWVTLLALVAGLVPIAAQGVSDEPIVAQAADAAVEPSPDPAPPPTPPPAPDPAPRPAPPAQRENKLRVEWHDSTAHGGPNGGSLSGGVRLPAEGEGYYTYNPATQEPPGGADRQWGTAALVREVRQWAQWWALTHPKQPRLGIGDLSQEHGGAFGGPVVGHASHQNGLDVDIRLPRADGVEGAANPSNYDRGLTQSLLDHIANRAAVTLVLIGPSLDLDMSSGKVVRWPAHDDHLHIRIADPDGTGN
ncbi:MAG: penicillin-insensitive murein endopeptidase [Thermoleophilia bacterium]